MRADGLQASITGGAVGLPLCEGVTRQACSAALAGVFDVRCMTHASFHRRLNRSHALVRANRVALGVQAWC